LFYRYITRVGLNNPNTIPYDGSSPVAPAQRGGPRASGQAFNAPLIGTNARDVTDTKRPR